MSLQIIHVSSPELPFTIPLADGLHPADKLQISVDLEAKSCLDITLKASDEDKIDSRIPLSLSVSVDNGIVCKCGKNKKWEIESAKSVPIQPGIFLLTIIVEEDEYRIEVDGNLYSTFKHTYPPFISEILDIKVSEGAGLVKSVSYTREMKWLGSRVDAITPETALKCGKDDLNNDIYLGRGLKNNNLVIVSVNPVKKEATVAFNGREWPIHDYELLQDNSYYGWKLIDEDKKIPENAVEGGFNEKGEKLYIGRATNEGSLIPGTLHKETGILSIPFKGKELKLSSRFEILTVLTPTEVKNKKNPPKFEPKADTNPEVAAPVNNKECIICFVEDITTALTPCGHWGFCEKCAKEYLKTKKLCPICRENVTSCLKVFKVV